MAKLKEGDRVRIVRRPVTDEDKLVHKFFEHMQGLTGVVSNYYSKEEVAVTVDLDSLPPVPKDVHSVATQRMRSRFASDASEELKKLLEKEELEFTPNYVLLLREVDLEKA